MNKSRLRQRARLWVEELETRIVMSSVKAPIAVQSTNWSGYAAQTSLTSPASNAVSAVSGSWTVPTVTGSGTAYASVWVGIDGYSSNTVEQIGTDSDLVNGVPTYYAWYEMYPNGSINIPSYNAKTKTGVTVNANDVITASVTYSGSKFTLTIADTTDNESYTPAAQALKSAQRSSAEWVVEAPSSFSGVLPLANFGAATFANASATINGTQSSIDGYNAANPSSPLWQYTPINMITSRGAIQATTGALTDTTTSTPAKSGFSVAYSAPAAPTPPPPQQQHHNWWWWFSFNEALRLDAAAANNNMNMNTNMSTPAFSSASFAAPQTPASVSAAAPPVVMPLSAAPSPWLSLTGPAVAPADDDADADANMLDARFVPASDLFHPTAFALTTATNTSSAAAPLQAVPTSIDVALVAEAPAVSNAPPASQPEPRGAIVTKTMSKAFWLVAGLAFVSHRAFARGKRQIALHQDENEGECS